jgi:hypothetical protein
LAASTPDKVLHPSSSFFDDAPSSRLRSHHYPGAQVAGKHENSRMYCGAKNTEKTG